MANWDKITSIIALILSAISLYQSEQANKLAKENNQIAINANKIAQKQFESNISISIRDGSSKFKNSWNSKSQKYIEFEPIQDNEYSATFMKDFNIIIDNLGSKTSSIIDTNLYRNYDDMLMFFTHDSFEIVRDNQPISLPFSVEPDNAKTYLLRVKFYIPKTPWKASGLEFKKYSYDEAQRRFEDVGYSNFGQYVSTMGTGENSNITARPNMYYQRFCLEFKDKLGHSLILPIHFNVAGTYDMLSLDKRSPICTNLKNYKE